MHPCIPIKKLYHFKVFHVAKTPAPSLKKRRYAFSMPNAEITLSIARMKPDEVRVLCQRRVFTAKSLQL